MRIWAPENSLAAESQMLGHLAPRAWPNRPRTWVVSERNAGHGTIYLVFGLYVHTSSRIVFFRSYKQMHRVEQSFLKSSAGKSGQTIIFGRCKQTHQVKQTYRVKQSSKRLKLILVHRECLNHHP